MQRILTLLTLSGLLILTTFCQKKEIDKFNKELFLYGEFSNKPSESPTIDLNLEKSSDEINISDSISANIEDNRIRMEFNNFRIEDELGVYEITEIITEEKREGEWIRDSENFLDTGQTKNLDVLLVLDVSSSLGKDVQKVKDFSKEFINILFDRINDPKIGVIGFSQEIEVLSLTRDKREAKAFIEGLKEEENATKLYEAMDTGLTIIEEAKTRQGKSMVTFTDGRNNSWNDVRYENSNYLNNRLASSDITSYTIGLQGKGSINKDVLKKLAKKGRFQFPKNTQDLGKVFRDFAKSVASTNRLIYDRNNSPITEPIKLRFRFKTQLK